jgi:hypothetical protein
MMIPKINACQFIVLFIAYSSVISCNDRKRPEPTPETSFNLFVAEISMEILEAKRGVANNSILFLPTLGDFQNSGTIRRDQLTICYEQIPGTKYIFRAWLPGGHEVRCIEVDGLSFRSYSEPLNQTIPK